MHTARFNMDSQQGPVVEHRELSQWYVAAGWTGVWGGWMHVCVCVCMYIAESLHCSPKITTALLPSYIPIQHKKFKKNTLRLDPQTLTQHRGLSAARPVSSSGRRMRALSSAGAGQLEDLGARLLQCPI